MKTFAAIACAAAGALAGVLLGSLPSARVAALTSAPNASAANLADGVSPQHAGAAQDHPFRDPVTQRLATALKEPVELRRRAQIHAAIRELQSGDFQSAADMMAALPLEFHYQMVMPLFERWFRFNAAAAAEWLRSHPRFIGWAAGAWRTADPKTATRAILDGALGERSDLICGAAGELSGPEAAAHWVALKRMPEGPLRTEMLRNALESMAARDPAGAFRMAGDFANERDRVQSKLEILKVWAGRDTTETLARLSGMILAMESELTLDSSVTTLVAIVAAKDAPAALEWVQSLPAGQRAACGVPAAQRWATKEPVKALEWCVQNGVPLTRLFWRGTDGWESSVLGAALREHPAETVTWLENLPSGSAREELTECALADALRHLSQSEKSNAGDPLVMRLFAQLPAEAQERHAVSLGSQQIRHQAIPDLSAWADQFRHDGLTRQRAIEGVLNGAFRRDATQVEPLLASLKSPTDRDAALRGLVESMSWSDPVDAATRAMEISTTETRREALEMVFLPWRKNAPKAAAEWLATQGTRVPLDWQREWEREK
jgi:hypothetical protein